MTIQDVLDNKSFYVTQCIAQQQGDLTALTLWNPVGSGVLMSLVKSHAWCSIVTEFNLKRTATLTGFGVDRGVRNSKYFPGTGGGLAQSKFKLYMLDSGTVPAANSLEVYHGQNFTPHEDEYPFTMGPGEGLVLFPDTTSAVNWCWSATVVETDLPA